MSDKNIKTVQTIYEAFGRGDVATILDQVAEDVNWASEPDGSAPWHGIHKGKGEVPKFFEAISAVLEVTEFTPLAFASSDTDVMAVIRFGVKVPATGKSGVMDLHHWFRFDADGKVVQYRGTEDTALTERLLAK
jgi:ketosteroid isomerase-like protein